MRSATSRGLQQLPQPQRRRRRPRRRSRRPCRRRRGRRSTCALPVPATLVEVDRLCDRDSAGDSSSMPWPCGRRRARRTSAWCRRSGAISMPCSAKTCQSNLMFWPILRTPGPRAAASAPRAPARSGSGRAPSPPPNRLPLPLRRPAMGRAARSRPRSGASASAKPHSSACIGSSAVVSVSIATTPARAPRAIQASSRSSVAHDLVARAVDLGLARSVQPRRGERLRRDRLAGRRASPRPARRRAAAGQRQPGAVRRPRQVACGAPIGRPQPSRRVGRLAQRRLRPARSPPPRRRTNSATRRVSAVNSIALRNAISRL